MKSKLLFPLLLSMVLACCTDPFVTVRITLPEKRVPDFKKYKELLFLDTEVISPRPDFDPRPDIQAYFTTILPKYTGKPITMLTGIEMNAIRSLLETKNPEESQQLEQNDYFQKVFSSHPQSLFITGKIATAVKEQNIIKEVRDEQGNKKNQFVKLEVWELTAAFWFLDGDSVRLAGIFNYSEKQEVENRGTIQTQFKILFDRITDRFHTVLSKRETEQERYLLIKNRN